MRDVLKFKAMNGAYPKQVLGDVQNISFESFLNMARWLAASDVFIGHLRNPLFEPYNAVPHDQRTLFVKLWYFVSGWPAEAVIVFFVLSGYLVGGIGIAKVAAKSFKPRAYLIDRLTRLYVAFLPALLLTAVLDTFGSQWFGQIGFYDHTHPMIALKVAGGPFSEHLTWSNFAQNFFMLQTIVSDPFGSNDPLWTISLEFWFYMVFGLVLAACTAKNLISQALLLVSAVVLAMALGHLFIIYFGLWLIGAGAAFVPGRAIEKPVIAAILFLAVMVLSRIAVDDVRGSLLIRSVKNYAVASSFAWLLVSMRSGNAAILRKTAPFNNFMSEFSYSLYLIHFPLMLFILGALYATGAFQNIAAGYMPGSMNGQLAQTIVIIVVYLCSWLFAQATERQTWKLRAWIKRQAAARAAHT